MALSSIELAGINMDKSIPLPLFVVEDKPVFNDVHKPCQGRYFVPLHGEVCIDGTCYPLDDGIIFISSGLGDRSTVAHEFRHHWQRFSLGYLCENDERRAIVDWEEDYENSIVNFFRIFPSEFDALMFSMSMFPNEWDERWYTWLMERFDEVPWPVPSSYELMSMTKFQYDLG